MTRVFDDADRMLAAKLFDDIRALSQTSPYPGSGVTRASYGVIESQTLEVIAEVARAATLFVDYDDAANLWIGPMSDDGRPHRVIGSHVDSVPDGGNFDGLAGVIAGLLCLRKARQRGTLYALHTVALRGEESAWFGTPYIGAKALFGQLTAADLARPFRGSGQALREYMRERGAKLDIIERGEPCIDLQHLSEFWELHIEQGPVLVDEKLPVGAVTGIRGNVRHAKIDITGEAGHSGTVPRKLRHDAVAAFADFISRLNAAWADEQLHQLDDLVMTCGIAETDATVHAITRIPDRMRCCLEWRSFSSKNLDRWAKSVKAHADQVSTERGVKFHFDEPVRTAPAQLDQGLVQRTIAAIQSLGLPVATMPSGAGHDAAIFANAGIPTGMVFVRNANGSHNAHEAMDIDDFMIGVEVLYKAVTS